MTTEKQIAANRANAQKSTGPKTAAGRLKSSRNAFRHGLSLPLRPETETSAKADTIARAVTGDIATEKQLSWAHQFAEAQLELLRIRMVRGQILKSLDLVRENDGLTLRRLAALDRYERYAHTRRRRASQKILV